MLQKLKRQKRMRSFDHKESYKAYSNIYIFDWETVIIARNETEKARDQCLRSFNSFKDFEKRKFWWEGLLKKTGELNEIEELIKELEAVVDDKATDRL